MKNTLIVLLGLIVTIAIAGGYVYPKMMTSFGASPTGTTFNTAKVAMIVWAPATTAASSTSILNGDANDRIIDSVKYSCSGVGALNNTTQANLPSWIFTAATSSVAASATIPYLNGNLNYVLNTNVATTSVEVYVASTTPGYTGTVDFRRWAAGSYLIFAANASSTATCVIGVNYFGT